MKRISMVATIILCVAVIVLSTPQLFGASSMADKNDQGRNLTGQVLTKSDSPLSEAIVYLKNTKTLTIKTFITEKDGGYRFHNLSQNVDYEVYADYQGQKSSTKTISSFDNRSNITLNIRIDTK